MKAKLKILVVDDETSFGTLLGRALRRLGHEPVIAAHPVDALAMFREAGDIDAVITDIDMPMMSGVELATAIRAEAADIPIAFCTGSSRNEEVVAQAEHLGAVLPKVWTLADVKRVLGTLVNARSATPEAPPIVKSVGTPPHGGRLPTNPTRKLVRKIKVTCRTWQQVVRLCDEQSAGRDFLTLRGSHKLKVGERLTVALSLPDELVLSIAAEVATVRCDPVNDTGVFSIRLSGLTPDVCVRLRSMVRSASQGGCPQVLGSGQVNLSNAETTPVGPLLSIELREQSDEFARVDSTELEN